MPVVDTVIVGGGSAGCVLAARLSQARDHRVLLLEAGEPDVGADFEIPARLVRLIGSAHDWGDITQPQAGLGGRKVRWPRGRALGGSSAINATLWVRPRPADFDDWRHEHGLVGWGSADLLPALRRAEEVMAPEPLRYAHELSTAFVAASRAVGLADSGVFAVTQRLGVRRSAASAYLRPALARDNLQVRRAVVSRVLFRGQRAVGVELADGTTVPAGRVVVCAGAVGSPLLLQRSGIGSPEHLARIGVRVLVDAAVGEGLADHLAVPVLWLGQASAGLHDGDAELSMRRWSERGDGPLVSGNAEAYAFAATGRAGEPDLQLHAGPAAFVGDVRGIPGVARFTIAAVLLRPSSRGWVRASGSQPDDPAFIDPRYLADDADADALAAGAQLAAEIGAAGPLRRLLARRVRPTDDCSPDWRAHVRARASTLFHPTGTVAAGRILDGRLAVAGTERLHVVDASVFPAPVRANTNAAVLAVAERAADLLTG